MRQLICTVAAALCALVVALPAEARPYQESGWEGASESREHRSERRSYRSGRQARSNRAYRSRSAEGSGRAYSRRASRSRSAYRSATRAERVRYSTSQSQAAPTGSEAGPRTHAGVGPRPGRWCGWWMRTQRGGGPELNLARNWAKWGSSAGGPRVGAVVVWRSHVGEIVGQAANGQWIVRSGNDGGRVRTRARSIKGAIAFRM